MRRSDDLPRRRRPRVSGRAVVITLGVLLFLVAVFGRALARFYVDALWYRALGRSDVFWGQIGAKSLMFLVFAAVFAVLAGANLYVADRTAPTAFPANVHPYVERFHEVFGHRLRLVRYGTAAVLALILGLPAVSQWKEWLLFRNSKSFGFSDPQFGVDVGFYVFQLPFLSFTVDWLFAALVIVIILTLAAHLLNGGVLFAGGATPTVRPATRIHLAVLLAVLAAVKAADYWLTRYQLTSERRGFVQGATYTVVNAQLPALMLLVLIALLTAVLFLSTIRTNRWRYPVVASALWLVVSLVGGLVYPALVESLLVRPNQEERERTYIGRNVEATRQAMGLTDIETHEVAFGRLTADEVESDLDPLRHVRLLNPAQMLSKFSFDVGEVAGLQIVDLDVDRYPDGDATSQMLVAARELDLDSIPNKSWQGRHLVSTRGCGLVIAPVGRVNLNDRPVYQEIELDRKELYFGDAVGGYAITGTSVDESRCDGGEEYAGDAGVRLGGFMRRAAFALAFLDYNILGSGAVNSDSQMLWVRSVHERVNKLAPFLSYDTDPYPVAVGGGVQWVIDAYTSTDAFPYAQRIGDVQRSAASGLSSDANYVRNSVKAVVDAYTGEATFYVMDDDDPILRAWRSAFPDLFTPLDEMPDELRQHLRYPEDLFRVQTEMYSKYQLPAEDFFRRAGAWSVAQAPAVTRVAGRSPVSDVSSAATPPDDSAEAFATESGEDRFIPYYTMFRNAATGEDEFVILRPFVPFSTNDERTELQAFMTASSDPDSYGRLTTYVVEQSPLPAGPLRVADRAESDSSIGPELGRLVSDETGQEIRFGDMQMVPVADGLIYVRPVYVTIGDVTEFRYVIVSHNESAVMEPSLDEALERLFPGYAGEVGDRVESEDDELPVGEPGEPTVPDDDDDAPPLDADVAELLIQASAAFAEADEHLAAGDLGAYQEAIDRAERLVQQATDQLNP